MEPHTLALASKWAPPAINAAMKPVPKVPSAWNRLVSHVAGPRREIVVTGAAGVGKSVLLDAMQGKIAQGYTQPRESQRLERAKVPHDNPREVSP